MKKYFAITLAIAVVALAACNSSNNNSTASQTDANKDTTAAVHQTQDTMPAGMNMNNTTTVSVKDVIAAYLQMKNAFTNDNTNDAATAGKNLQAAFINLDTKTLSADQQKTINDITDDAKEHAEHIGANGGNIAHQREHFDLLSKDMADLVKTLGTGGQTLYKDFCPMYNNKKGAYWLSETKEIKNPYLGKAMPACGVMKEEIKQ
ncbi:DUF3347 domain-containing protein [Panacibacter ginsenosidivorans]|uniref:DUF3347 domain-containing protein n=1 Tax=Panacibacter ginsenosidivorans TaxID=1813871 RepID=A0A5B8VFB1_9BACT|nr:DUF3347 domain-containing protein [Panacibacter ginsenosidivorans]QEC69721.1 DUF3347 domain-containing protein [Panacibacter ginsenosidivorans]